MATKRYVIVNEHDVILTKKMDLIQAEKYLKLLRDNTKTAGGLARYRMVDTDLEKK